MQCIKKYLFYNKGVLPPSHTFINSIIYKFKSIYIYKYILLSWQPTLDLKESDDDNTNFHHPIKYNILRVVIIHIDVGVIPA